MKIAHLNVIWTHSSGVVRKAYQIASVSNSLRNVKVECILVMPESHCFNYKPCDGLVVVPIKVPSPQKMMIPLLSLLVWKRLSKLLNKYDAVVSRWTVPSPQFLREVCNRPVFTEHHSIEAEELKGKKGLESRILELMERKYAPQILGRAKGIIAVTNEIRAYELGRSIRPRPTLVLPNGVCLNSVQFRPAPSYSGGALHIAFLSNRFSYWQGLDRMLTGLADWRVRSPKLVLHLLGEVNKAQKADIKRLDLEEMIQYHGVLREEALENVMSICHIAMGSLAVHRKGLTEACALKVREYTARGLPFVIAYDDPDYPDELPWVLRLEKDDSPVPIEKLIGFAERMTQIFGVSQSMRSYAEHYLSWKNKVINLSDFVCKNV